MLALATVAFLLPLVVSALGCRFLIKQAPRLGWVDLPSARKNHGRPIALGGGWSIFGGVSIALLAAVSAGYLLPHFPRLFDFLPSLVQQHAAGVRSVAPLVGMLLGAALVQTTLGFIDDRRGLDFRLRLGVEAVLVLILATQGVRLALLPDWEVITVPLTVLWVVGLTNAFNFLDNMDGLSAGVGAIASLLLATTSWFVGDLFLVGCYLILLGALGGFLWFNWSPARIFMGDAGSNFLGFWIGTLSVLSTFKTDRDSSVTLLAPLCILAVPIYDVVTVTLIRLSQGKSPFHADRQHFSHRLVEHGFRPVWAVSIILLVTLVTGLSGLSLYFVDPRAVSLILLQLLLLLVLLAILELGVWRRHRASENSP